MGAAVAFRVCDANGDGYIDKGELMCMLKATNSRMMTDSQLDKIVEAVLDRWATVEVDAGGNGGEEGKMPERKLNKEDFASLLSASSSIFSL